MISKNSIKVNKICQFIRLAEELLSEESMYKLVPILRKDCDVIYDIGINGAPGKPGDYTLSSDEISSVTKALNIKLSKSGDFVILPHSFKNSFND